LREAGSGSTAAASTFASRAKNWSLAFMELLDVRPKERKAGLHASLHRHYPYRFEGFDLTIPHRCGARKDP
jgi:hypothetical protein